MIFLFSDTLGSAVDLFFKKIGMLQDITTYLGSGIFILFLLIVSVLVSWLLSYLINIVTLRILRGRSGIVAKMILKHNILSKIIYILPPILILISISLVYVEYPRLILFFERFCHIYLVLSLAIYVNFILEAVWVVLDRKQHSKNVPLHGFLQLIKGVIISLALIVVISIIIDKSPINLITGLGAFAAVLMLVFKDTILGFVAGIQLSQNDIIRKGDWISASDGKINGIVSDITLNTVKVLNFDNTVLTIPPYTLLTEPMQNWRAMQESGGRRIKVSFLIETDSIKSVSSAELNRFKSIHLLKEFFETKRYDRAIIEGSSVSAPKIYASLDTNLGVFRTYIQLYILSHPLINKDMLNMVRLLQPTENGVPLELYCFTISTEWKSFEAVRSEITEHIYSLSREFGVRIYQNASGFHYIASASISAGKNLPNEWKV